MFVKVENTEVPDELGVFVQQVRQVPKHLCPLDQSGWPESIIEHIEKIYKAYGIETPRKQKLVEPFALVFGGKKDDGANDFSNVNWDMALDYFEWEAAAMFYDDDDPEYRKIRNKVVDKYGGVFSHYQVYESV